MDDFGGDILGKFPCLLEMKMKNIDNNNYDHGTKKGIKICEQMFKNRNMATLILHVTDEFLVPRF